MNRKAHGFTIVELLIVIVVIAILAAISIAAYTNIQDRAENSKTIAAAEAYLKAIQLYKVETGDIPKGVDGVCLGQGYPWDYEGTSSGDNQCRGASVSYYRANKGTLNTTLAKYIGSSPESSMRAIGSVDNWWRGITYYHTGVGGEYRLSFPLRGSGQCSPISGITPFRVSLSGGFYCSYPLGPY